MHGDAGEDAEGATGIGNDPPGEEVAEDVGD